MNDEAGAGRGDRAPRGGIQHDPGRGQHAPARTINWRSCSKFEPPDLSNFVRTLLPTFEILVAAARR